MTDVTAAGIAAVKAGDKVAGRDLLSQVVISDPDNAPAWLWLSAAVQTNGERRYCLEQVLRIIPNSPAAKKGLATLPRGVAVNPLAWMKEPAAAPVVPPVVQVEATRPPVVQAEAARTAPIVEMMQPPLALVEPRPIVVARPTRSNRWPLIIGGTLALIVLLGVGVFAVQTLSRSSVSTAPQTAPTPPAAAVTPTQAAATCDGVQTYLNTTGPLVGTWGDAVTLAGQTQRINLPAQIDKLQAIRRDMRAVKVPTCAKTAHAMFLQGMDDTVDAYLSFLAQGDETLVQARLDLAKQYEVAFAAEQTRLAAIAEGKTPETSRPPFPLAARVDGAAIRAAFDARGYALRQRQLTNGLLSFGGTKNKVTVEVTTTPDGALVQFFLIRDLNNVREDLQEVIAAAQIVAPQWTEAQAWIGEHGAGGKAQIFVGRLFIRIERLGDGGSQFTIDNL